jgi:hypothetical protein
MPRSQTRTAKEHLDNISRLTSLAVASAKIRKLTLYEEKNKPVEIRPQLHILLRAPTGAMKSTILRLIREQTGSEIVDEATRAGLVGTIDQKTMQVVPGSAWTQRRKVLLFDEFRFRRKTDDWTVFLKLLEDQTYSRKLGMFSVPMMLEDGDLYFTQKDGQLNLKTRIVYVIATMKRFESHSGMEFKAFVNRCVPYEYSFNLDEIESILKGGSAFNLATYKPDEEVEIKKETYFRILKFVRHNLPTETTEDEAASEENYARTVGDICRIHAIEDNTSWRFAKKIIGWKLHAYKSVGIWHKKKEAAKT